MVTSEEKTVEILTRINSAGQTAAYLQDDVFEIAELWGHEVPRPLQEAMRAVIDGLVAMADSVADEAADEADE